MKTSDSKSRSGYSQRLHVQREMVCSANGSLSQRNFGHCQELWAYDLSFHPQHPFPFISCHPYLSSKSYTVPFMHLMSCVHFWHPKEKQESSNVHLIREQWKLTQKTLITCAVWGATVLLKTLPHGFLNKTFSNQCLWNLESSELG